MKTVDFLNREDRSVIPIRIREARVARGFSQTDLAEKLDVTKQVISKYELGTVKISSETLILASNILNFPISFFFKPKVNHLDECSNSVTFFRSLRSTPKKIIYSLEQNVEFISEIYNFISKYIEFPKVDIPDDINDIYKINIDDNYIEKIALQLRDYWGLDRKPIKNLTNLLLKKGFIISRVELETHSVDAFSKWVNGKPYIILGSDKKSAVRSRFDLAHELGHLILHSHIDVEEFNKNITIIENEANKFASAFLLPEEEFSKDIYSLSLNTFIFLKEKWKISIAAMIYRGHDLEIINDEQYTSLMKQISYKKWRQKEPLDDVIEFENPNMIKEALELLIDNELFSIEDLIEEISLNPWEIENLCFLPSNYFKDTIEKNTKPKLKIIK